MNTGKWMGPARRSLYRLMLGTRYFGGKPTCEAFGSDPDSDAIERIYVINLDRHDHRMRQMRNELDSLRDKHGASLVEMTRRFSAVDARYLNEPNLPEVRAHYLLADQLFVDPNPRIAGLEAESTCIEMTRQEVAVALSHIAIWRRVASGECRYALVLEDDVCFRHGFAGAAGAAWSMVQPRRVTPAFDILYLSYEEALAGAEKVRVSERLFRPLRGLWQLSGYVLSVRGAQRLLNALPVCGPVDLWLNHQFQNLEVLATMRPIIEQRPDCASSNAYSILPVLSTIGVLTREKPLLPETRPMPGPVFALGEAGSGLTSLARALSMTGYRCCSDVTALPAIERDHLFNGSPDRVFDAYVNVGALGLPDLVELAKVHRDARFIIAGSAPDDSKAPAATDALCQLRRVSDQVVLLPSQHSDKWGLLCDFLGLDYPGDPYPHERDIGQRGLYPVESGSAHEPLRLTKRLRTDLSPWIVDRVGWHGVPVVDEAPDGTAEPDRRRTGERFDDLDPSIWSLRNDTFPSNLALFSPDNFSVGDDGVGILTLRASHTQVRDFTSASVCSRERYLYGHFAAQIRPAAVSGLVTGLFLHRNSPRQEIDIEFLGKDTTKMLVNVYYNPGSDGARMEYGYRGTPTLVDLGFDAADALHRYEIEWAPSAIRWYVDGMLVCSRANWDPTPVPHLPMQLNVNLWHSRSREFAGRLAGRELPATAGLRSIEVAARFIVDSEGDLRNPVEPMSPSSCT